MTKLFLLLLALMLIILPSAALKTLVLANGVDEWPMFHHDLANTGYTTSSGPSTNETLWVYSTYDPVMCSPAISGGYIYFGGSFGNFYCLDADTGAAIWSNPANDAIYSSPAVADGKVYFGSNDGEIYCLNATDGTYVWSYPTGDAMDGKPKVAGGYLYIVSSATGTLFCLDASTGTQAWNATDITGSPAIVGDCLYVGAGTIPFYKLNCLNATDGSLIWSYWANDMVTCSPAVADGLVYFGCWDGSVYCVNASTGEYPPVWSYWAGTAFLSSPAVAGGLVYIGSNDYIVYCLNGTTGTCSWVYSTGGMVCSAPAVNNEYVYVNTYEIMYCLNASTGTQVWYSEIPGWAGSPAIANGKVYAGSVGNSMYCFGESAPSTWSLTVSSDHGTPNPSVGEHFYNDSDTVECNVTSPVTESGHTWNCTGWTGTGSVPSSGSSTDVSFSITENSTILWNWEEIVPVVVVFNCNGLGDNVAGPILAVDGTNYTATNLPTTFYWVNSTLHTFRFYSPISAGVGQQYMWNSTSGLSDQRVGSINATVDGNVSASYTWTSAPITPDQWAFEVVFGMFRWIFVLAMLVVILVVAMRGFEFAIVAALISVFMAITYLAFLTVQYDLICALLFIGVAMVIAVKMVMDET
jgi:outer membrane protein assembly factor BamB